MKQSVIGTDTNRSYDVSISVSIPVTKAVTKDNQYTAVLPMFLKLAGRRISRTLKIAKACVNKDDATSRLSFTCL